MRENRYIVSNMDGMLPLRQSTCRFSPGRVNRFKLQQLRPAHPRSKPHRVSQHRPRCDCGKQAITVLQVRVGSDPQYTIHLPLCAACLDLEQSFHTEG